MPVATNDTEELSSVCRQLDTLLEGIFERYSRLQALHPPLGHALKEGHLSLAQARHHMQRANPVYTVGSLQYPRHMEATLRVAVHQQTEGTREISMAPVEGAKELPRQAATTDQPALKQRKAPKQEPPPTAHEPPQTDTDDCVEDEPRPTPTDPLKWFGLLVPPALRSAQRSFRQATHTAISMAELRSQLAADMATYEELMARKQKLVAGR